MNPVRNRYPTYSPKRIGVASITFAPVLEGFFREAKDVIEVHLQSIRQTIGDDADVLVFDNCSCLEVTDFLKAQHGAGIIDWLILSRHNLGKTGTLNWIFSSMPNEYIVSTDSDVLFRTGWAERSLEVFDTFEKTGIVSAQPGFFNETVRMRQIAEKMSGVLTDVDIDEVNPFPDAFEEYCDGVNASEDIRAQMAQNRLLVLTPPDGETRAVLGSTSMQFMIRRDAARQLVPLPATHTLDSDDHMQINRKMEDLGYLQLSLLDPLVYHMGNTLQGRHMAEVDEVRRKASISIKSAEHPVARRQRRSFLKRMLARSATRNTVFNQLIRRVYSFLFDLLYSDQN